MINLNDLHKIRGVSKTLCTCEQKLAYNFSLHFYYINDLPVEEVLKISERYFDENPELQRYNKSAVLHLIETCCGKTYRGGVAWNYETVAKFFPVRTTVAGMGKSLNDMYAI